jgi:anti-sigma factor (TIGR02949 family)
MSNADQSQQEHAMKSDCLEKLQSILDGEASVEERKNFLEKHLEVCMPCYKNYHLEMAIRELLKSKCANRQAPVELINNIKSMINSAR